MRKSYFRLLCFLLIISVSAAVFAACSKIPATTQSPAPSSETPEITSTPNPTEPGTPIPTEPGGVVIPTASVETTPVRGLSIDREVISLHIGNRETITITVEPEDASKKTVTWASGNPSVVEITSFTNTSATILGRSQGSAVVTATSDDGGKVAACIVTVSSSGAVVPVTKVTLDASYVDITVGSLLQLGATVSPANATINYVTWSSNFPNIASVSDDGLITAKGVGTAVITARSWDGAKTAECTVRVVEPAIRVTGIELDTETATMAVGDSLVISAAIAPENATNREINWSSDDTSVATVTREGVVTAQGPGTATITAATSDGNITAFCQITVSNPEIEMLSFYPKSYYLNVGKSHTLSLNVYPEDADTSKLVWKSSNESVVTVSPDGKITAISAGVATVTVSIENGMISAHCSIIVLR